MTILKPAPSATSAYASAQNPAEQPTPAEQLLIAEALFARRDFPRCLSVLRRHLVENPDDLAALVLLVEAGGALRPYEKTKWVLHSTHFGSEIRHSGTMSEASAARTGHLLLVRGEVAAASAVCDWLERHHPNGAAAARFLADFYHRVGEPAAALACLAAAAAAHPEDADLALLHGERLVGWGRAAEALSIAEGLTAQDDSPRALMLLARTRIAAGAIEAVPDLLERMLQAGASAKTLMPVVRDAASSGQVELALRMAESLARSAPGDGAVARLVAELSLWSGDDERAFQASARAMAVEPTVASGEALAELSLRTGRSASVAQIADGLRAIAPGSLAADIISSKVLRSEGDNTAAEALEDVVMARAAIEATAPSRRQRVRVAGMIGPGGLGDFVYQLLVLCSLKRQFVDAGLTLFYNNDYSYKRQILRFCPDVEALRDCGDVGLSIPINRTQLDEFRQHLFFSHTALSPTLLTRLDRTATLVTPPEDVDSLTAGLIARGLDPSRWFVAIHYRDSGSFAGASGPGGFDPANTRDVDPDTFHRLAASICEAGGQVVRLGHPGMAAAPKVDGYVDLIAAGLPLQLFAVSKARFMVACDSGPTSYATAFKTPLLKTNTFSEDGAAYAQDLILNKNLVNWRGEVLSVADLLKGRKTIFKNLTQSQYGFRLVDNTFEQLRYATDLMMQRTPEAGWREDMIDDPLRAPDVIAWPTQTQTRALSLDLSHLAGRPLRRISPDLLRELAES